MVVATAIARRQARIFTGRDLRSRRTERSGGRHLTGRAILGPWFEANGIIPIFVVWQSGFLESAADILETGMEKIGVTAAADGAG